MSLIQLTNRAPTTGYAGQYVGRSPKITVHGLVQCWNKLPSTLCKSCISEASQELPRPGPQQIRAIIWYNDCLLKYLTAQFLSITDMYNQLHAKSYDFRNIPLYSTTTVMISCTNYVSKLIIIQCCMCMVSYHLRRTTLGLWIGCMTMLNVLGTFL